ncbi:hypothetical protein J6590_064619, partial [Homalodisca vitripennis]
LRYSRPPHVFRQVGIQMMQSSSHLDLIASLRTTPHSFYTLRIGPSFRIYEVVAVVDRKIRHVPNQHSDCNGMTVLSLRDMCWWLIRRQGQVRHAPDSGSRAWSACTLPSLLT